MINLHSSYQAKSEIQQKRSLEAWLVKSICLFIICENRRTTFRHAGLFLGSR